MFRDMCIEFQMLKVEIIFLIGALKWIEYINYLFFIDRIHPMTETKWKEVVKVTPKQKENKTGEKQKKGGKTDALQFMTLYFIFWYFSNRFFKRYPGVDRVIKIHTVNARGLLTQWWHHICLHAWFDYCDVTFVYKYYRLLPKMYTNVCF